MFGRAADDDVSIGIQGSGSGFWMLDAGFWMLENLIQDSGFKKAINVLTSRFFSTAFLLLR
jgi:hypothetical protein